MKICYFTATGNCLYVAKRIGVSLKMAKNKIDHVFYREKRVVRRNLQLQCGFWKIVEHFYYNFWR